MQQDQILELAYFLKRTMIQVGGHQEVLYQLDTRLLIPNKTLMPAMQAVSYLILTITLVDRCMYRGQPINLCNISLKEILMHYLSTSKVLASHKLNPLSVPPVDLLTIQVKIKHKMRTNPRLELPDDLIEISGPIFLS